MRVSAERELRLRMGQNVALPGRRVMLEQHNESVIVHVLERFLYISAMWHRRFAVVLLACYYDGVIASAHFPVLVHQQRPA